MGGAMGNFGLSERLSLVSGSQVDDVTVEDTWQQLSADPGSVLIDVRTRAEWAFVGLPDLSGLGKRVVTVEWQSFPDNSVDPQFQRRLAAALQDTGVTPDTGLYFICRSGGRSRMAAEVMTEAGFTKCHNVKDGFEGPLDDRRHRGTVGGWKAAGLPWVQG